MIYLGFRLLELLVAALPRRLAYAIGTTLASLAFPVWRAKREALLGNLRRVLPAASEEELHRVGRRNLANSAKAWIDFLQVPHVPRSRLAMLLKVEGEEHLDQALRLGRGVLLVSIHLGSWEIAAASWASQRGTVGLLAERIEPPRLFQRFVRVRSRMGITVIPLARTAVREMLRMLKDNQPVCVAMDRDLLSTGAPFRFFGEELTIPTGAVEIAWKMNTPILPVFCTRQPDDTYLARGEPFFLVPSTGDRDRDVRLGVERLLRLFEREIREHPDQWHVLEPLWPALHERPAVEPATRVTDEVPISK